MKVRYLFMTNLKLTKAECPSTRKAFVAKWRSDGVFRAKAELAGFRVIADNVIFPSGKVADTRVV
jgi:hypothetical protein